jgi:drug/metabolite transporter (DMT)-like permease
MIIYFRLIKTIGSMGAASQAYLRSGFGVALGVFILGDVVTPLMGLGMAAAILGVVLINWPKKISPAPITP